MIYEIYSKNKIIKQKFQDINLIFHSLFIINNKLIKILLKK